LWIRKLGADIAFGLRERRCKVSSNIPGGYFPASGRRGLRDRADRAVGHRIRESARVRWEGGGQLYRA
jgi:hypothetical protein